MHVKLAEVAIGGALVGALWLWLQYFAWSGVRYQRRAAWLRPSMMRRVLRAARRRQRALDREIRRFLRRAAARPTGWAGPMDGAEQGRDTARGNEPPDPDTLKRQPGPSGPSGSTGPRGPAHRKPGPPR